MQQDWVGRIALWIALLCGCDATPVGRSEGQARAACEGTDACDTLCMSPGVYTLEGWEPGDPWGLWQWTRENPEPAPGECAPRCSTDADCRPYEACSSALSHSDDRICVPSCELGQLTDAHACQGRAQTHVENLEIGTFACGDYCSANGEVPWVCDRYCFAGDYCDWDETGECQPIGQLGDACSRPTECESRNCGFVPGSDAKTCLVPHGAECDGTDCAVCARQADGSTFCHASVHFPCHECGDGCPEGYRQWGEACYFHVDWAECPHVSGTPEDCAVFCSEGHHIEMSLALFYEEVVVCVPDADRIVLPPP